MIECCQENIYIGEVTAPRLLPQGHYPKVTTQRSKHRGYHRNDIGLTFASVNGHGLNSLQQQVLVHSVHIRLLLGEYQHLFAVVGK